MKRPKREPNFPVADDFQIEPCGNPDDHTHAHMVLFRKGRPICGVTIWADGAQEIEAALKEIITEVAPIITH